jgi:hypothetical protein
MTDAQIAVAKKIVDILCQAEVNGIKPVGVALGCSDWAVLTDHGRVVEIKVYGAPVYLCPGLVNPSVLWQ